MKVAVTSQNRLTVTPHAGRCQRFWVYDVEGLDVRGRTLLEVTVEETFHANHHATPAGLQGISALITGGMGQGLAARLAAVDVHGLVTPETDPDRAVAAYAAGALATEPPHAGHGHHP